MASYILRAKNPSKLSSAEFVYYVEGGWSTDMEKVVYYFEKEYAEEALKEVNNPSIEIEIIEVTEDAPKADAIDGDGDGIVEEGTDFERPVEVKKVTRKRAPRRKKTEG